MFQSDAGGLCLRSGSSFGRDKVVTETYPSGRILTFTQDGIDRVFGLSTKASSSASAVTVFGNVQYMPWGPIDNVDYGNGLSQVRYTSCRRDTSATTVPGVNAAIKISRRSSEG